MSWNKQTALPKAVFLLALLSQAPAFAVTMAIPGNRPLTGINQDRVTGVIAQVTELALAQLGFTVEPRPLPFARMYKWVHSGRIDVALSVLHTAERAQKAHYSKTLIREYTVIVVPKGRAFPLSKIGDLAGKKVGGIIGFAYPTLDSTGVTLIRESNYRENLQKVAAGRLDAALIGSITGIHLAREMGILDRVEFLENAIGAVDLGVALSRTAFSGTDLERFNAAVDQIKQGKRWSQILHQSGATDLIYPREIVGP